MSKRQKQRRGKGRETARPSLFFIIVLVLGLIFLAILFVRGIGRPAPPGLPGSSPAQQR